MHTVSMKCNEQERRASYSWLIHNNYSCDNSLYLMMHFLLVINCEKKTFEWCSSVPDMTKAQHDNVECKNLTQLIGVVQTIEGMPKYDIGASVDYLLKNAPKAIEKLSNAYSSMTQKITISKDFTRKDLPELGHIEPYFKFSDYPVELNTKVEICKGTFNAKEVETLDNTDIRHIMGQKQEEFGNMYISEEALADLESWLNMQQPRKTQKEWFETPLADLNDIPFDTITGLQDIVCDSLPLTEFDNFNTLDRVVKIAEPDTVRTPQC